MLIGQSKILSSLDNEIEILPNYIFYRPVTVFSIDIPEHYRRGAGIIPNALLTFFFSFAGRDPLSDDVQEIFKQRGCLDHFPMGDF